VRTFDLRARAHVASRPRFGQKHPFFARDAGKQGVVLSFKRPIHKALYLQVRDALAERIASGEWKAGRPLANEGDLARELGVSGGTVRKALELMETQRLITRRQGRGTFVRDQSSEDHAARFCRFRGPGGERLFSRAAAPQISEGAADDHEARRLGIARGDTIYRMRRVRRFRGQAFMIKDAAVPAALFPDLPGRREVAGDICTLAQAYGILAGTGEERISLATAEADVAEALGVAAGTPVLHLDRVVHMLDGPPLEWSRGHCYLPGSYYLAEVG
jgi:GntR family transcriptional regulator